MTLFVTADSCGKITDLALDANIAAALAPEPAIEEVFIYAHGWQTDFRECCADYNRFASGLLSHIGRSGTRLALAVHWPSSLGDACLPASIADVGTFYLMEKRADVVGGNAVASVVQSVIRNQKGPLRITLLGHSFGCKVIMAALDQLAGKNPDLSQVGLRAILLQAAFDHDAMEPGKRYGDVAKLPVRVLATTSTLDVALMRWFPFAASLDPLNILTGRDRLALGAVGPTPATRQAFGTRLTVADLTPVHQQHKGFGGSSGSHSDIFCNEVYDLVARF